MKTIKYQELELIEGGGWFSRFVAGVCVGWGAAHIINAIAYTNPISGTAATILNVGCLAYGASAVYTK